MLTKLVKELPQGAQWKYAVKSDGYRIQAVKDAQEVCLFSRRGNDFATEIGSRSAGAGR